MNAIRGLIDLYKTQAELLWKWRPGRRALIKRLIVVFIVAWVSLLLTAALLPGLVISGAAALTLAVIAFALVNALIRPVILFVFASISVVAVIVATLVFQILAFYLVEWLVPGFDVDRIFTAFLGSIVFALFNTVLSAIFLAGSSDTFYGLLVAQLARRRADRVVSDTPGVVILQIDGLAHPILAHQIRAGRVPFIAKWVRSGQMRLDKWTALLPSQTSASQAGILHGNNSFIPAFRWWEKERQVMMVSNHPADAAEIVRRASDGEGLLSNDGASVGNLVSGDAVRSYITMATIQDKSQGLGHSRAWYSFFVSPDNYLRMAVLTIGEVFKEYYQARRAHLRGIEPSMHRGMPYPVARAATNVALRSLGNGARHGGDLPRHAGDLHGLHRLRRDRPSLRPGTRRDARRARRRRFGRGVARQGDRGRAAAVQVHPPVRPRPEPRRHLPAALRQDPGGDHRRAHGRCLGRRRDRPRRGVGVAQRRPDRGLGHVGGHGCPHPGRVRRSDRRRHDRCRPEGRASGRRGRRGRTTRAGRVRLGQPRAHLLPPPVRPGVARDHRGALPPDGRDPLAARGHRAAHGPLRDRVAR